MKNSFTELEFNELIYSASKFLKTPAYRFTKNKDDANDLIQDTLLKALKNREKFQMGTNIKAWLYIIMKNTFITQYNNKPKIYAPTDNECAEFLFTSESVSNQALMNLNMEIIQKALNKLTTTYKVPFIQYYEGYKYEEIAKNLNIPVGTVKNRIHVARQQLMKSISIN